MALLAKQGWSLLTNPDTLVSKVYKAKYYSKRDFLSAAKGANPSLVWQSIWQAQDIIKRGYRWRIGDGSSVRVWQDPWLHDTDNLFVTTPPPTGMEDMCVRDLMIPELSQWDTELIEEIFNERDAEEILKIPLRSTVDGDGIIWAHSKHGGYSVSSGYRMWLNNMSGFGEFEVTGPWKNLWNTHVPPKLKIMAWRLARDIIPTRDTLRQRHIQVPDQCGICGHSIETNDHLFLECDFAKECWERVQLMPFTEELRREHTTFQEWLAACINTGNSDQVEKVMALLWSVWRERNARVWRDEHKPPLVVARLAMESLEDWKKAREHTVDTSAAVGRTYCQGWHPPDEDHLKCNVDCARFDQIRMHGSGASIRDDRGALTAFLMTHAPGCPPVAECEALALEKAIMWVNGLNMRNVIFETDSQMVALAVNGHEEDVTEFGAIVRSCKENLVPTHRVVFVRRDRNEVAHCLARQSRFFASPTSGTASPIWLENVMSFTCSNTSH
ncbi:Putative ribonuclease H protein At1g65750 [Linum perenne]